MKKFLKRALSMLCAAVMLFSIAGNLRITSLASASGYALTITGPTGTVYPYTNRVKTYLQTENANMMEHYEFGTLETGDASFSPVSITWNDVNSASVTKYVVEYATNADYSNAISVIKETQLDQKQIDLYNLYKASTYYVRVTAYANTTVLGQAESTFQTTDLGPRLMKIDGIYNVRDLGGYKTEDGKTTLQGLIYRGSEMDGGNGMALTAEGDAYMSNVMGIKLDMDLRGNSAESPISSAEKISFGIGAYLSAFSQQELYRSIFSTLANENNYPVYIHCTGGADRTGTVCYLINALLGVPEADLIRDYEMTSYSVFNIRTKDHTQYQFRHFVAQLKSYEGASLKEKAENYMLSIGVTQDEISNIRAIMLGEELRPVVSPQAVFNTHEDTTFTVGISGSKEIASVTIDGKNVVFTATSAGFSVAAENMPEITETKTVSGTVLFTDQTSADFRFTYSIETLADKLAAIDSAHKIIYEYSQFSRADGTVADADAVNGMASYKAHVNMLNTTIQIHRYDANGATSAAKGVPIGNLGADEVNRNQGYQLYKFTVEIPASGMTDGNYVFFLSDWTWRLNDLCKDMKKLAGQTVDMYLSMKVTGDSASDCTIYIDRFTVVTHCDDYVGGDNYCTQCGKDLSTGREPTLAEQLAAAKPAHKIIYEYNQFTRSTGTVADADAVMGMASYVEHVNMLNTTIQIHRYDGNAATSAAKGVPIGNLGADEVNRNQGYQLYKFTVDIPANGMTDGNYVFFLSDWTWRLIDLCKDMKNLAGQTVDMYLSMKVTGDSASDCTIYIDRFTVVTHCDDYVGGDGCCTQCGKDLGLGGGGSTPDAPVLTDPLAIELYNISDAHKSFVVGEEFFGDGTLAYDKDSFDQFPYYVSANLNTLNFYICIPGYGSFATAPSERIQLSDTYRLYKCSTTIPANISGAHALLFGDYSAYSFTLANQIVAHAGEAVDFYISVKATGEQTNATVFIDKVVIVSSCDNFAGNDSVCSVCGKLNHTHTGIQKHSAVAATCVTTGNVEYWTCSSSTCAGKYYADANCTKELTDITIQVNPDNHPGTELRNYAAASCNQDGYSGDTYCTAVGCQKKLSTGITLPATGHMVDDPFAGGTCTNCGDVIAPAGITVSGTITSFGDTAGEVTVKLLSGDVEVAAVTSTNGTYRLTAPAAGTYTLTVAKANHATRSYEITVADTEVTQNVKIHLKGDVTGDGKVNVMDVNKANAHSKGTKLLTGYELQCADVTGDGKVNVMDVNRMNAHSKGTKALW